MSLTLKSGDKGELVMRLQSALLGLDRVEYDLGQSGADGIFGPKTKKAVMIFQTRSDLTPTGAADAEVFEALGLDPQTLMPKAATDDHGRLGFADDSSVGSTGGISTGAPTGGSGSTGASAANPADFRSFRLTEYFLVDQHDYPTGSTSVNILAKDGNVLARCSPKFFATLNMEGSGVLTDGRLIGVGGEKAIVHAPSGEFDSVLEYHKKAYKSRPDVSPRASGLVIVDDEIVKVQAFEVMPASRRGIGFGVLRGIPLVPFRTLAADLGLKSKHDKTWKGKGGLVPAGTRVFISEYVGKVIPGLCGVDGEPLPDGTPHDGWFVVNDTGGAIFGVHFDVFVGGKSGYRQGHTESRASVWFDGITERIPATYDYGLKEP